jgi:hypothetical protein
MIPRNYGNGESSQSINWRELSDGVPTLGGLANLCSRSLAGYLAPVEVLSDEARAILWLARERGVLELQIHSDLYDSSDRLTAVVVELSEQKRWMFKRHAEPRRTIAYLEGLRQLCQNGWVIHQSQREFSLTAAGFAHADSLDPESFAAALAFGQELDA